MASSRGKRATHSTTATILKLAGARGQHRCNTRLGGWTQCNAKEKNREQSVIMCVIVGDVPNSGYILRFTQEHACLRISTKPVDMPEDSPQTPQHPPKVTHRPERTWGNLIKTKGKTKYPRQSNTRRPHHYFTKHRPLRGFCLPCLT